MTEVTARYEQPVGASLLAMTTEQPGSVKTDPPLTQAGSLRGP